MKYGLSEAQLAQIIDFLAKYPEVERAILFGSRAIDTFKAASDVDIAIDGVHVTHALAARIKLDFEEDTYLPYFFDIIAYPLISEPALTKHIDRKGVVLYQRQNDAQPVGAQFIAPEASPEHGQKGGMSGWRACKLGSTGRTITGKTPSKDNPEDWGSEVLFITPSDYKNYGKKAFSSIRMLSKIGVEKQKNRFLPIRSVLVTCIGSDMGKTVINALPCVTNQQINAIIPDQEKVDSDYLYYLTKDLYETLSSLGSDGTAVPILNKSDFENIDILIPPLPEQKAIASVLSSLDDKIDLLHRQNQTLEAMAQTLFRQWFVEEAREDWEEVALSDVVELNTTVVDKYYAHSNIQYLDTGSLTQGQVSELQMFNIKEAPSRAKRLVRHNDVLISTVRPNQKHYGIIKSPPDDLVVSTGFCVLTCTKIDPHFVFLLLTSEEMTEHLHSIAEGSTSTYPSLKPSDIGDVTFLMPDEKKLVQFADFANNEWLKISRNQQQIQTLTQLRDTLLPKLMSGEVRII